MATVAGISALTTWILSEHSGGHRLLGDKVKNNHPIRKRGLSKPTILNFFLVKSRISSKSAIIAVFSIGIDELPLEPKT
jgi:hypothetical protein